MAQFVIYNAEPDILTEDKVAAILGDASYELVRGSFDLREGDSSRCNTLLMRSRTRVDASIIETMPKLQHIVRVGTGLDAIDLDFCDKHTITVHNAPGANADAVAEYVVATVLYATRKLHQVTVDDLQHWNRFKFVGKGIASRRIGIVGFGNIGRLLHAKLTALGCTTFYVYDPFVKTMPDNATLTSLKALVAQSDIVSLHVPLLPETTHLFNNELLITLPSGSILVNASRGGIVDEEALLSMIDTKNITYIADTVEGEPTVNPNLLQSEHVIVTPHIASLTEESEQAMLSTALQNLLTNTPAPRTF